MTQTPASATRLWKMLFPLFAVVALAIAWSYYWWVALGYAKAEAATQREMLSSQGYGLSCQNESWAGYPFRFEYRCQSPVINFPNGLQVQSHDLHAVALAYKPRHIIILLDGPTALNPAFRAPFRVTHNRAAASIEFGNTVSPTLSVEIGGLEVPGMMSISHLIVSTRPSGPGIMDIAMGAENFSWRGDTGRQLQVDTGNLRGTLTKNRVLLVDSIELRKDEVRYWGSGQIELDGQRRILGKLATQTDDLDGLLHIVSPHLLLPAEEKSNLRLVLGLLGQDAKADIVARNGELYLGPFKIVDLLPLY